TNTPDDMRGRVSAVHEVVTGASNELGEFESGMLAALVGAIPAILLGGIAAIAAALAWNWLFPAIRKADRIEAELSPAASWPSGSAASFWPAGGGGELTAPVLQRPPRRLT